MRLLVLLLFFVPYISFGQRFTHDNFGAKLGLVANFGTHVNSIGLSFNAYYHDYFYQLNVGHTVYLNERSYGGRRHFWEHRGLLGLVLLAGDEETPIDPYIGGLNHQTKFDYALGYNYIWYFDNRQSSQRSGAFSLHYKQLSIQHENDIFAGKSKDRFRTAQFQVNYRHEDARFSTGIKLWTGETRGVYRKMDREEDCPHGYKDLQGLNYGKTSHGIAYVGVNLMGAYQQFSGIRIGIDSEQLRHVIQNKLIHDFSVCCKKQKRSSPHYPRLNEDGLPVFTKEEARPNRFYYQMNINDLWSY